MNDEDKTRAQLIEELHNLRKTCNAPCHVSAEGKPGAALFRNIVEYASDAIISIDTSGSIVFFNRRAEEMFGYTAAEVVGTASSTLLPETMKDEETKSVRKHSRNQITGYLASLHEGLALCKNGSLLPIEASYYGYHIDGTYFMTSIIRDISKRKKAEKELEESRDFSDNIIESSVDPIVITNSNGIITRVNSAFLQLLGFNKKEQVLGQKMEAFSPDHEGAYETTTGEHLLIGRDYFEAMRSAIARLQKGQKLSLVETYHLRTDNRIVPVEDTISPLLDETGVIIGSVGVIRDISERKRASMMLRISEERYRRIFDNAFVSLQEIDISRLMAFISDLKEKGMRNIRHYLKEHPEFIWQVIRMARIIDINDATLKMYGAKDKEELMASVEKLFSAESTAMQEALVFLAEGKSSFQAESVHHSLWGRDINVLIQIKFLTKQRDLNRILVSIIDITQIKTAEKKLVEYQNQLRSLTNELSTKEENERRNLGMYLHDRIGQSLSALKMQLEMMASELTAGDARDKCRCILKQIEATIHDTRVLSYELSPVILHELGLEVALGWITEQTQQQHDITVSFKSDKKAKHLDDSLKILVYRAVSELLHNVVKHAGADTAVVSVKGKNGQLHITVEDNGIGFDPSEIEGVAATERGFGLFSIRERLHHFGGSMRIKSAPNKGTRITLLAPLK